MTNIADDIRYEIKNWWWYLVMGLLCLAAGIAIFTRPAAGYVGLSVLFTVVMAGTGISQIAFSLSVSGIMRGWGWTLVSGIVDLAIGTYLLLHPAVTMVTLPYFVGFYLIFRAFYIMGTSFDLKNLGVTGWGWVLVGGILLLALGILTLYYPAAGVVGIVAASGSAFLVSGLFSFLIAFQLKSLKNKIGEAEGVAAGRVTVTAREEHRRAN